MLRSANISVAIVIRQTHIIVQILCDEDNINGISMHTWKRFQIEGLPERGVGDVNNTPTSSGHLEGCD